MKILNSSTISPFGGYNFVIEEFDKLGIDKLLQDNLPYIPAQSKYNWKDILYSFWGIYFCGGDCIEDLSVHLKSAFKANPRIEAPSPDRVLDRLKELAIPSEIKVTPRGKSTHQFSINEELNILNQ